MTHQELQLWDHITSNIGFDEEGQKLQDAIRKFVALKVAQELEEVREEISLLEKPEVADESEVAYLTRCNFNLAVDLAKFIINHRLNKEKK